MDTISTILNFYENENNNKKENYGECFKLPIEYLDNSNIFVLNSNIINDLELLENKSSINDKIQNILCKNNDDTSNNNYNLYYHVFDPCNIYEKKIIDRWSKYYTNNKEFLL